MLAAGYELRQTGRSIGAAVGTSVHRSAALSLDEKARTGSLPPTSLVTDCASETLRDELGRGETIFDGPNGPTFNASAAERQVVMMAASYHRTIAPVVRPLAVERRLEAAVGDDLVLSGAPDLVAVEPDQLRDLKTGVRAPNAGPQIGAYSLLVKSNRLTEIVTAAIDFVKRVRPDKPQPDPVSKPVELAHAEVAAVAIIKRISIGLRIFRHGDQEQSILPGDRWAFTSNPSSILCSEKYCPCYGLSGPNSFCHDWQPK